MKINKIKVIVTIAIIIIAIVTAVFIVIKVKNKSNRGVNNNEQVSSSEESNTEVQEDEEETVLEEAKEIESTKKNPIEKDGVVAEKLELTRLADQLEVKTTIKNDSKEKLNGYSIDIELIDDDGNTITTIAHNSNKVIEPGQGDELLNYVMGIKSLKKITGARIAQLTKSNIADYFEKQFEEMEPEEIPEEDEAIVGPQLEE